MAVMRERPRSSGLDRTCRNDSRTARLDASGCKGVPRGSSRDGIGARTRLSTKLEPPPGRLRAVRGAAPAWRRLPNRFDNSLTAPYIEWRVPGLRGNYVLSEGYGG